MTPKDIQALSGAELGRLLGELSSKYLVIIAGTRLALKRESGCVIDTVEWEEDTLELSIRRAYLWLKTNEEKSDDSHAEMDINLARIDQLRGGEE